jgi:hypothetical protein
LAIARAAAKMPALPFRPFRLPEAAATMPEEMEIPIEQVHEHIHHEAHHSGERWVGMVALCTAILAGLAAIASLLSGLHANEAIDKHIFSNDKWGNYQEKNIKATILETRVQLLKAFDKPVAEEDVKKVAKEKGDMKKLHDDARDLEDESSILFQRHETLAPSVTLFQVAVAISAIAVLTKRQWFWYLSLVFGVVALGFLIVGEAYPFQPKRENQEEGKEKPKATVRAGLVPGRGLS